MLDPGKKLSVTGNVLFLPGILLVGLGRYPVSRLLRPPMAGREAVGHIVLHGAPSAGTGSKVAKFKVDGESYEAPVPDNWPTGKVVDLTCQPGNQSVNLLEDPPSMLYVVCGSLGLDFILMSAGA